MAAEENPVVARVAQDRTAKEKELGLFGDSVGQGGRVFETLQGITRKCTDGDEAKMGTFS